MCWFLTVESLLFNISSSPQINQNKYCSLSISLKQKLITSIAFPVQKGIKMLPIILLEGSWTILR